MDLVALECCRGRDRGMRRGRVFIQCPLRGRAPTGGALGRARPHDGAQLGVVDGLSEAGEGHDDG